MGRLPVRGRAALLIVNAEEGEPGVFKDRHLLESDPHRVIEGMLIAAYTMGASRVVVYVNGQATLARERLTAALTQAHRRKLIGKNILGAAFSCDIDIREGAGGYVLGEESVILESVEGHRPMPRIRPPYPVEVGLRGRPTAINNVETLANLPLIVTRARRGSPKSARRVSRAPSSSVSLGTWCGPDWSRLRLGRRCRRSSSLPAVYPAVARCRRC